MHTAAVAQFSSKRLCERHTPGRVMTGRHSHRRIVKGKSVYLCDRDVSRHYRLLHSVRGKYMLMWYFRVLVYSCHAHMQTYAELTVLAAARGCVCGVHRLCFLLGYNGPSPDLCSFVWRFACYCDVSNSFGYHCNSPEYYTDWSI